LSAAHRTAGGHGQAPQGVAPRAHDALRASVAAYERARASAAAWPVAWVVALSAVAFVAGAPRPASVGFAAALAVVVWWAGWRGGAFGRSVPVGLLGGTLVALLSIGASLFGGCCSAASCCDAAGCGDGCAAWCTPAAGAGGVVAGLWAVRAARRNARPLQVVVTAATISALGGALGCSCIGYAGALAMLAGLVVVTASWLLGRRLLSVA
jgi:hypothetical protein